MKVRIKAALAAVALVATATGHASAGSQPDELTTPFTIDGAYGSVRTTLARFEAIHTQLGEASDPEALFRTLAKADQVTVLYFAAPELIESVQVPLGRCTPEEVRDGCYENAVSEPSGPAVGVDPAPPTSCASATKSSESKSPTIFGRNVTYFRFYQRVDFCFDGAQVQTASVSSGYENVTFPWACETRQTPPPGMPINVLTPPPPAGRVVADSTGLCRMTVSVSVGPFSVDVDHSKSPHVSRAIDGSGVSTVISSNGG